MSNQQVSQHESLAENLEDSRLLLFGALSTATSTPGAILIVGPIAAAGGGLAVSLSTLGLVPIAMLCAAGLSLLLERHAINQVRKRSYAIRLVDSEQSANQSTNQGMICAFKNEQGSYQLSYRTNGGHLISWEIDAASKEGLWIQDTLKLNSIETIKSDSPLLNLITSPSSPISKYQQAATFSRAAKGVGVGLLIGAFVVSIPLVFAFPPAALFMFCTSVFVCAFAGGLIGGLTTKPFVKNDSWGQGNIFSECKGQNDYDIPLLPVCAQSTAASLKYQ